MTTNSQANEHTRSQPVGAHHLPLHCITSIIPHIAHHVKGQRYKDISIQRHAKTRALHLIVTPHPYTDSRTFLFSFISLFFYYTFILISILIRLTYVKTPNQHSYLHPVLSPLFSSHIYYNTLSYSCQVFKHKSKTIREIKGFSFFFYSLCAFLIFVFRLTF